MLPCNKGYLGLHDPVRVILHSHGSKRRDCELSNSVLNFQFERLWTSFRGPRPALGLGCAQTLFTQPGSKAALRSRHAPGRVISRKPTSLRSGLKSVTGHKRTHPVDCLVRCRWERPARRLPDRHPLVLAIDARVELNAHDDKATASTLHAVNVA